MDEKNSKCVMCKKEDKVEGNLCAVCLIRHEFLCYKIKVSPRLLDSLCTSDKKLNEAVTEALKGERRFYYIDRLLAFIQSKDGVPSSSEVLDYLIELQKEDR